MLWPLEWAGDPTTREFVYVPIPEERALRPEMSVGYEAVIPALDAFCRARGRDLHQGLRFPMALHGGPMHLDPDFRHLTYGDNAKRRASEIAGLGAGDFLAFYAGLRSVIDRKLIYALIGLLTVDEVVAVGSVPEHRLHENAHTRRVEPRPTDIVVRGRAGTSGRLTHYIPIGEWRDRAYRVRRDLLDEWGGLSVRGGYIQRSARPPRFLAPDRFL